MLLVRIKRARDKKKYLVLKACLLVLLLLVIAAL
jgi:uncharacterized integral membrane protein